MVGMKRCCLQQQCGDYALELLRVLLTAGNAAVFGHPSRVDRLELGLRQCPLQRTEVARDVVARRLRFDASSGEQDAVP